jgi:hypothetical protein
MMSRRNRPSVLVALLTLALAGLCVAQDRDKDKPKDKPKEKDKTPVQIQVLAIRATTKSKDISPELKPIADALKKQYLKFTGFKLEKKVDGSAKLDEAFTAELLAGYEAKITPKNREGKRIQFQYELLKSQGEKKESLETTTATIDAGKFQLWGGRALDGGDVLIVAVSVR